MKGYEISDDIEVLRSFLEIPLGSADGVFHRFLEIPGAIYRGDGLERFLYVRGSRSNKVLFWFMRTPVGIVNTDTIPAQQTKYRSKMAKSGQSMKNLDWALMTGPDAPCSGYSKIWTFPACYKWRGTRPDRFFLADGS
ncbi:MAG: hypothetical protein ACLQT6_16960 [Desulfomonilaceae bacterium]